MEICITIDDVPSVFEGDDLCDEDYASQAEFLGQMAAALREADTRPIFFVNTDRIRPKSWSASELLDCGELGNHTASHCSIDNVSAHQWAEDVQRCNAYLHSLTGQSPRWFRYPYLRTGQDAATRADGEEALRTLGLQIVPGSCAPLDWLFARYYREATRRESQALCSELEHRAIENIFRTVGDCAGEVRKICAETVPLILVLHASPLLGRILETALRSLRSSGVRFIPWEAAKAAYEKLSVHDHYTGRHGPPYFLRLTAQGREAIDQESDWLTQEMQQVERWWRRARSDTMP